MLFWCTMTENRIKQILLPDIATIRKAVDIYMKHAWITPPGEQFTSQLPPAGDFDPITWIMGEMVERDYMGDEKLPDNLKSAAFRLGNTFYPNMKLRLTRMPNSNEFLFSVDSHDAILQAPEGTPDHAMLEELKAANAQITEAVLAEWDTAGIMTERNYLRLKIQQAKNRKVSENRS
ncbi:MAG TPA: hypothetical protein PLK08_05045 [Phycisphaerae bacterium]|nr:hypothetical protein [Phycisphaerae bacterium]